MDKNVVYTNNKYMRKGYTTGACAAAATYGAAMILLNGTPIKRVPYVTPNGIELQLDLYNIEAGSDYVSCAVKKDSADDPDITRDVLIYSRVELQPEGITIDGGKGVGRYTKKVGSNAKGTAAIGEMSLKAIEHYALMAAEEVEYKGGFNVTVYVPDGEVLAKRTSKPNPNINGGIAIQGSTGTGEPVSMHTIRQNMRNELSALSKKSKYAAATPGNYGQAYAEDIINLPADSIIKTSNFIGTAIDYAVEMRMKGLLIVGHIGKAVKLGAGIMNTHSHDADGRLEILSASALRVGCDVENLKRIVDCVTTDEAIDILNDIGLREKVMSNLMERIDYYLKRRACGMQVGAVVFSNKYGLLGKTEHADDIINEILGEHE